MNVSNKKIVVIDHRSLLKEAKKFFKKNQLHDSLSILDKLCHHGFKNDEILLLIARVYDKLSYLTLEAEYEEEALEKYNEIIKYSSSKRYKKKAIRLRKKFVKRISLLSEKELKACYKAIELEKNLPKSPKAWFVLGANFPVKKDPMFVINAYKNAVKLNENYIVAIFRIAYLYHHFLQDVNTAKGFYLKMIKIPPYKDEIEPKSVNVKTILEGCSELSDIYLSEGNFSKVLSVFDHAIKIFKEFNDICSIHDIKRILKNSCNAAISLNKLSAFKNHISKKYNIDFDSILEELGIATQI